MAGSQRETVENGACIAAFADTHVRAAPALGALLLGQLLLLISP